MLWQLLNIYFILLAHKTRKTISQARGLTLGCKSNKI